MCTQATTVWGIRVKVRSSSYGTCDSKSLEEGVLTRKQLCADEANNRSQSTFEISMSDFGQQRISACPQEEGWAPATSHGRSTLHKAE